MSDKRAVNITTLRAGEYDRFRSMLDVMGRAFEQMDVYCGNQPDDAYIDRLLGGPAFVGLVAEADGKIVGGLTAYELQKPEQARSEFYIYDLAVDAGYRRRGIATALIEALKPIARARGAWVIVIQADHGDDPAIAVYTRLGRREEVVLFDIDVG